MKRGGIWYFRRMINGRVFRESTGFAAAIAQKLESLDANALNALRDLLRVGIHEGVQVTDVEGEHLVSQAFCSALPVAYSNIPAKYWIPFAVLVLEVRTRRQCRRP